MFLLASVGGTAPATSLDPWSGFALALFLIAVNGFFVGAEFALTKIRPTQLEPAVRAGDRRARIAQKIAGNLEAYLPVTQLGVTLASIGLGWVGEPAVSFLIRPVVLLIPGATDSLVHSLSLAVAFTVISGLHILLGELLPKSIAIRLAVGTALWIAAPLYLFSRLAAPITWVMHRSANGLLRLLRLSPATEHELGHSEEELRLILASRHGVRLTDDKRDLLENVFELSDRVARQVMVPRADVVYLSTASSAAENLALVKSTGHTRLPLCDGDLDRIVGIVHIKDLFRAERIPDDLRTIARPVPFVPETTPLDKLLTRMRSERLHLAAVLDEYGGVAGVVTLENVIEEIVGPIQDEFDAERPELVAKGDGLYQVSGAMLVVDLEDELGIEFSERDEDTIAGVVLSELGRRPRVGDRAVVGRLKFEVLEVQGTRIRSLRLQVTPLPAPPSPG
jgi:CBS domain containing-hemolysin-like protein